MYSKLVKVPLQSALLLTISERLLICYGMTGKPKYSDLQIQNAIRSGGRSFQEMSEYLFDEYRSFIPKVKTKVNLTEVQIKDAFADSLVKLIDQIKHNKFRSESKLSTYFYTIFYRTAVDAFRKITTHKEDYTDENKTLDQRAEDLIHQLEIKEEYNIIEGLMVQLSDNCRSILIDTLYYGLKMEELAKKYNLSSAETARSTKYKCLKKLRLLIQNTKEGA